MSVQERQQVCRRAFLQLGRSAAGPRAPGHAVVPRPGLVVRFAQGAPGGGDEVASVILDEVFAARPVLGVLDVEHRADRLPAMMGAAIDLDLDAVVAGRAHALGILDGERRRRVVVAGGQHEEHRPPVRRRIAVLGGGAGADRDMEVEEVREPRAPALAHGDGGIERRHAALGDAHDADALGIDAGIGPQQGEGGEGIALHLRRRDQALVGHRAADAAAGEAVDDQGRGTGVVEGLGVVMLAMALDAGAAGQDDHARRGQVARRRQAELCAQPRRATARRMIERQRVERHRFHSPCLACPLGRAR